VTDPGVTDPGVTDPGVTDPGVTDPGVTDPGVTDPGVTDPGVTDPGVPRLRAEGLAKRFGGVVALEDVALFVEPGEVVGLLGSNGAGKTTLFNCLLGVERADRGTVWVDGVDVTRLPVFERARLGMARTFQRVELFAELTVRQHLAVAARARIRGGRMLGPSGPLADEDDRVESILERLGLEADADVPAASLSLGRTRLVELGRALATGPSVILADEPSSGLDDQERSTLTRTLPAVTEQGIAVLLIEHDLDLVLEVTTRVYVLEAGMVVASGSTAEVLANPVLARAYGRAGSR
jgi:ABC-type branched-subunit amino acid transport system ATPase component